jgi:shikimate kinase|tara:strand:- start:13 stop:501 length:489 start_codon:yes stop_codon:yes gene_type:complete
MNNISFIGMAGCGKSTVGGILSSQLDISFVDTDLLIEEKFKLSLEQLKKKKGYEFVRQAEEEVILRLDENIKVISTGGSAVYSEKSMLHLSSFSKIMYINTPLDEIKQRIGDGQERGLAAPDGLSIDDIYKERVPLYNKWADITLNGNKSIEDLVSKIISLI